jgi:hypothetical protein
MSSRESKRFGPQVRRPEPGQQHTEEGEAEEAHRALYDPASG